MEQATAVDVLVLAGTKDGVYLLRSDSEREEWRVSGPSLTRHDVCHVVRDSRGTLWAAANPRDGSPAIFRSEDEGETWLRCGELPACERAGMSAPAAPMRMAGSGPEVMPATLLRSDDRGQTWQDVPGLNAHPSRPEWWPGGGGLCMHTVILPEGQPGRVYAGISVAGFFRSDDDGETWTPPTRERRRWRSSWPEFFGGNWASRRPPLRAKVVLDPTNPETLYMQQHEGVYRSDDGGRVGTISGAVSLTVRVPVAAAPGTGPAACSVWVIPENGETIRTDDALRVWRTDDGGEAGHRRSTVCPREAQRAARGDGRHATAGRGLLRHHRRHAVRLEGWRRSLDAHRGRTAANTVG